VASTYQEYLASREAAARAKAMPVPPPESDFAEAQYSAPPVKPAPFVDHDLAAEIKAAAEARMAAQAAEARIAAQEAAAMKAAAEARMAAQAEEARIVAQAADARIAAQETAGFRRPWKHAWPLRLLKLALPLRRLLPSRWRRTQPWPLRPLMHA